MSSKLTKYTIANQTPSLELKMRKVFKWPNYAQVKEMTMKILISCQQYSCLNKLTEFTINPVNEIAQRAMGIITFSFSQNVMQRQESTQEPQAIIGTKMCP